MPRVSDTEDDHHEKMFVFSISTAALFSTALASEGPNTRAICKAGVAALMGQDPKIIRAKDEGEIVRLSYVRKTDSSIWEYRCKIKGSEIIWASKTGRWRTDPADEKLRYKAGAESMTVDHISADGGVISSNNYTWRQL